MALNPILNVYIIELNPLKTKRQEGANTFREFIKQKFARKLISPEDEELLYVLGANFLKFLGGNDNEFKKDKKDKKVIGVVHNKDGVAFHSENYIVDGIIEGGRYGIQREYANINKKIEKKQLGPEQAVLDNYYFLLHIPFNTSRGVLIIQSYTELSIQQTLKKELKDFFSLEKKFHNLKISNYVPDSFKKKYEKGASLRMFQFTNYLSVQSDSLRGDEFPITELFKVSIGLTPLSENIKVNKKVIDNLYKKVEQLIFHKTKLETFMKKKVFTKDKRNRKANYDIEKQISDIKPTIYLEDMGVEVNEATGFPNMNDVKKAAAIVLEECMLEIGSKRSIDEL